MLAKQEILDMWQRAYELCIAATFHHVYGESTGQTRYDETVDAFGREDDIRIVKSMQQLWEDAPDLPVIHTWPAWNIVCLIAEHIFDEDYPPTKNVPHDKRDPNINMATEQVHEGDNIQEGGEPAVDMRFEDLAGGD